MLIINTKLKFDWDEHNIDKNWFKRQVKYSEIEQVFFNEPLLIKDDKKHSIKEKQYFCLGVTDTKKYLFVSLTIRKDKIRVISARAMSRKERKTYEKA